VRSLPARSTHDSFQQLACNDGDDDGATGEGRSRECRHSFWSINNGLVVLNHSEASCCLERVLGLMRRVVQSFSCHQRI
jgi:hypothetical protein